MALWCSKSGIILILVISRSVILVIIQSAILHLLALLHFYSISRFIICKGVRSFLWTLFLAFLHFLHFRSLIQHIIVSSDLLLILSLLLSLFIFLSFFLLFFKLNLIPQFSIIIRLFIFTILLFNFNILQKAECLWLIIWRALWPWHYFLTFKTNL